MSPAPDPDSMTSCESIADHLFLTAGGDAEPEVQEQTRAHLADCEPCSERLREIQRLRQVYFESAHRAGDDLLAEEQPELWRGLRTKLEAEGLLRPAVRPVAPAPTSVAAPAVPAATGTLSPLAVPSAQSGSVLRGRFGSAVASPNATRAVAGLLAGAAAGLLIFGLGGQPDGGGSEQPVGAQGAGTLADASGIIQVEDVPQVAVDADVPTVAAAHLRNVLDADALTRELARISDEAWIASGQPKLRSVLPSEPDPAGYLIQETLIQPSATPVPWTNGLAGTRLQLKSR